MCYGHPKAIEFIGMVWSGQLHQSEINFNSEEVLFLNLGVKVTYIGMVQGNMASVEKIQHKKGLEIVWAMVVPTIESMRLSFPC